MDSQKTKKATWSVEAENILIDLWAEKLDDLRGARKNTHVYEEMHQEMKEQGVLVSIPAIKGKLESLRRKYLCEKSQVGPSGGSSSEWVHFPKLTEILDVSRAINVQDFVEQSTSAASNISIDSSVSEYKSAKKREKTDEVVEEKRKKNDELEEYIRKSNEIGMRAAESIDRMADESARTSEQIDQLIEDNRFFQNRLLAILEKLVDQ